MTTVALLTDDLILCILCKLDVKAIVRCATACKQWRSLRDSDKLWERLYEVRLRTACVMTCAIVFIPPNIDAASARVDTGHVDSALLRNRSASFMPCVSFGVSVMALMHDSKSTLHMDREAMD